MHLAVRIYICEQINKYVVTFYLSHPASSKKQESISELVLCKLKSLV
jgi:hypothetical protein